MFSPQLTFVPSGKKFILHTITEVPSAAFKAGKATKGAPESSPVGSGVLAFQLNLTHDAVGASKQVVHTVTHNLTGIAIPAKAGTTITAFVLLDGVILGSATLVSSPSATGTAGSARANVQLPPLRVKLAGSPRVATRTMAAAVATRPDLDDDLRHRVAVRNTPKPSAANGSGTQLLVDLDVTDLTQGQKHCARIQTDLNNIGWHISQNQIVSGPDKSVDDCSDSLTNAT